MKLEQVVHVWTVEVDKDGNTYQRYLNVANVVVKEGVLRIQQDNTAGNGFTQTCIPLWNVKRSDVEVLTHE